MVQEFNADGITIVVDSAGTARAPGGAAGDMMADGSTPWTGVQVPNADGTLDIGTTLLGFLTAFVTNVRARAGVGLLFRDHTGGISFEILVDGTVTLRRDLDPNATNTISIGNTAAAYLRQFVNNISAGAGLALRLETDSGGLGLRVITNGDVEVSENLIPDGDNDADIGTNAFAFRRAFLNRIQSVGGNIFFEDDAGVVKMEIRSASTLSRASLVPDADDLRDLGQVTDAWRELFIRTIQAEPGADLDVESGDGTVKVSVNDTGLSFFAVAPVARQDITGSRGGNAALADLLTKLALAGLITDSTT